MSRPPVDPEVAATLQRRAAVFALVEAMRARGEALTVASLEAAMRASPQGGFKPADYLWVHTTLAKRMP